MAYLAARRFGLTKIEPPELLAESGWKQVWEHPSGLLAAREPGSARWRVISISREGYFEILDEGFCSSLRAAAGKIAREMRGEWVTVVPLRGDAKPYRAVVIQPFAFDSARMSVVRPEGRDISRTVWRSEIERDPEGERRYVEEVRNGG